MRATDRATFHALAAVILLAGAVPAPAQEVAPPEPRPAEEVRFPDFVEKQLPNGLQVVVVEHHEQPAVSLRLVTRAGRLYEPRERPGLAEAAAALLTEGTEGRSAQEIAEAIDFVGGGLSSGSGWDAAFASAFVTSDQLDLGLDLLSDIVIRPAFAEEEIERWRKQTLNTLQINFEDPEFLASVVFQRLVFGDHPYSHPDSGTPDSVRQISRDDLVAFHAEHYLPNTSILAVVGDVEPQGALARVENFFGGWKRGEEASVPELVPPQRQGHEIVVIDKPDAVQTQIRVGHLGIARRHPDYFVAQVYNSVLGASSSSRLFDEIRDQRGLTYGAYSTFAEQQQPGYFRASTYTKTESTVETVKVLLEVVETLEQEAVPAAELEARKRYLTGAFPLEIETPDGIAGQVLDAKQYGYGKEYLETYRDRLEAVTAEAVQRFARERIHPERTLIVVAGNASGFADDLERAFGEFRAIDYRELDLMRPDLRRAEESLGAVTEEQREEALALFERAQEALGGDAYRTQSSTVLRGSGTLSPPGAPQPLPVESIVSYRLYPQRRRVELSLPFGPMIQVFDGEQGWVSVGGQLQDQTAAMKERVAYGVDLLRRDPEGLELKRLPDQEFEGRQVVVLAVDDGQGHTTRLFLDPETHLVLGTAYEQGGSSLTEIYDDYRSVGGVQIAHRQVTVQDGSRVIEFEIEEAEVGAEIDPALFASPEAASETAEDAGDAP